MSKVLLYARTATQKQKESNGSIPDQLAAMRRYAEARGDQIAGEYVDERISGNTDMRPAFQQMIEDALSGTADIILVESTHRLFRDHLLMEKYRRKLGEQGIKIVSTTDRLDDSDIGLFMKQCFSIFQEWQSRQHGERVRQGLARAKQRRSKQLKKDGPK
jgi:site-specific DNA recombinase